MKELANMRVNYAMKSLDVTDVEPDPLIQFQKWFGEAVEAGVKEPNAMILSTVDENNGADARVMLLKGVERGGFVFYTNYESNKGQQLLLNKQCAITFLWLELERQVRIKGICNKVDQSITEQYFQTRPRESQLGAWTSPQSKIVSSRQELEDKYAENIQKFKEKETIPTPNFWGGFCVVPKEIEFWQGRPGRLHDRVKYILNSENWQIVRLAP